MRVCNLQAMKEKLRTYKQRALASEHIATQKNSQIIVMENAISTLKQQLAVGMGLRGCVWKFCLLLKYPFNILSSGCDVNQLLIWHDY